MSIWLIAMFTGKKEAERSEQRGSQVKINAMRQHGIGCQKSWFTCIIYPSFIKCHWDSLHFIWSMAVIPVKQVCHLSWHRLKKTILFKLIRNLNMWNVEQLFLKDEPWYLLWKFINWRNVAFLEKKYLLVCQTFLFCSFLCHSKPSAVFNVCVFYFAVHRQPLQSLILKKFFMGIMPGKMCIPSSIPFPSPSY